MENEFLSRSRKVLAQGETGTNSKRPSQFIEGIYPTHVAKGDRCYLYDLSGKRYLDFISGLGTNLLGYSHPKIVEAVVSQLKKGGPSYSLPHHLEVEVAEMITDLIPHMEKMRFLKTGNEATLAAVRIARALNGKKMIINEGYHGHGDLWTSLTPPALGIKDQFNIMTIADVKQNEITEPVMMDMTSSRKEYLKLVRERCNVLIFDEIVTGFRVPKYTVSQYWEIIPNLTCLGKAIANGFPLSVVGGKKEIMDCGEYFISSTFSGETLSLAACKATIEELKQKSLDDLYFYANRIQDKFNEICKPIGTKLQGYGTRAMLNTEHENTWLVMQEMCKSGVLLGKAWFYGFSHMEEEIEESFLNLLTDCVNKISLGKVKLEGKPPKETFKR